MNGIFYYHESNLLNLLRFYEDYTVIGVTTSATLNEISTVLTWFDKENSLKSYSEGAYTLTDSNQIHFKLKSSEGEVEYTGELLEDQEIKLNIHSHINNYRHDETYVRYEHAINSDIKPDKKKYNLSLFKRPIQKGYTKRISMEMKKDLELAFEYFVDNIDSPYVIFQIQYKDYENSNVYLIAKEPSKETYYGIMEGPYIPKKQITTFPEGNITHSSFKEISIEPFLARQFIEKGIK